VSAHDPGRDVGPDPLAVRNARKEELTSSQTTSTRRHGARRSDTERGRARPGLLARLGRWSAANPWRAVSAWLVLAAISAPLAITLTGALSGAGWEAQGSVAQRVRDTLRAEFPELGAESAVVAYRQPA
jgi:hypothetical protein